jgi:hypothetical protein
LNGWPLVGPLIESLKGVNMRAIKMKAYFKPTNEIGNLIKGKVYKVEALGEWAKKLVKAELAIYVGDVAEASKVNPSPRIKKNKTGTAKKASGRPKKDD